MPHLSDNRLGWDHWYHLTMTAYGQWLRGDPRGWRERHHRIHVDGNYKSPPTPTSFSEKIFENSRKLLKHAPAFFAHEDREEMGHFFLDTFEFQKVTLSALAVGGAHVHVLARCPNDDPEFIIGRAKQWVWTQFHQGQPRPWPKLWVKRPYGKPVRDAEHCRTVRAYVIEHLNDGAWVWCDEMGGRQHQV